ncbi:MAG: radical SAM family heme chaperone HemW [Candidatus Latescibacterota bacterium]|jgi:oxygen-independent coproporphyrinogen-3 oxidase|nr:MAG: radical SAM family heme chaperone HemW [Candidatus Latescibacterota bacterium]
MKRNDGSPDAPAGRVPPPAGGAGAGLYVHAPFCRTKCPYCGFYSTSESGNERRWLAALDREAGLYRGVFPAFDTLYVGGGTPSLLGAGEVSRLFDALRGVFVFSAGFEATIEANPDDVDADLLAAWRGLGVTRLSLGVQSFDDAVLRRLRRRHDASSARGAIALAREAGFANIGVDLMYGIEGQTLGSWMRTLETALDHAPEHLSCYELTIDAGTEFGARRAAGTLRGMSETAGRRFLLETSALLRSRGYVHYEVSNFARGAAHVSRHNLAYWRGVPYLGLGPSAHSFDGDERWWNVRPLDAYLGAAEEGRAPVEGRETIGEEQRALESLSLGFRTADGVPLATLRRRPGWEAVLDRLVRDSLVSVEGDRAVPTIEGFCVADRIALLFAA